MTYNEALLHARRRANDTHLDQGIERFPLVGYVVRHLPAPERRYGADLRCEVVRPGEPATGAR